MRRHTKPDTVSTQTASAISNKPTVLYIDPFASEAGHMISDDQFLTECLAPLVRELKIFTSEHSISGLRAGANWQMKATDPRGTHMWPRLRLILMVLRVPFKNYSHVIFQTFEEISVLLFKFLRPRSKLHLIVTNNLRPDRLKRHPILGRCVLRLALRSATTIIVHSRFEVERIVALDHRIPRSKIAIKPFHQIGFDRIRVPWHEKQNTVLFIGPIVPHKSIVPLLGLIDADRHKLLKYKIIGLGKPLPHEYECRLNEASNVEVVYGYMKNDQYYSAIAESRYIFMSHDADFEGTLSGVFCDAIACGTALIASSMEPHREWFMKCGNMGFLVDYAQDDWWAPILGSSVEATYPRFAENMETCRRMCTMEKNRDLFRRLLSE